MLGRLLPEYDDLRNDGEGGPCEIGWKRADDASGGGWLAAKGRRRAAGGEAEPGDVGGEREGGEERLIVEDRAGGAEVWVSRGSGARALGVRVPVDGRRMGWEEQGGWWMSELTRPPNSSPAL